MTDTDGTTGLPADTPILTPRGQMPIERITAGTLVIALSGRAAPFQTVQALRRRRIEGALVRIRAGALAEGSPLSDLLLAPGHGLFLDGRLVPAGALATGPGVGVEPAGAHEVFDLVLAEHDAVLAAGVAVETAPGGAPFCARTGPDGVLLAMLALRAEAMGWAEPAMPTPPVPEVGSLRERLAASPFLPARPSEAPLLGSG